MLLYQPLPLERKKDRSDTPGSERPSRRTRRVGFILSGVVLLSLADLLVTLWHLRGVGMYEANPIAVYLIRATNSPWLLAAFKGVTVAASVLVIYSLRRHWQAEIGAWCCAMILAVVMYSWCTYVEAASQMPREAGRGCSGHWVVIQ